MVDLAIFASHPIQYKAPLYRRIARTDEIDLTVFYGAKYGVTPANLGFEREQTWDLPLLEGYDHQFLRNYSPSDEAGGFTSLINPSLLGSISSRFDALLIHTGYYRISSVLAMLAAKTSSVSVLLHGTGHEHHVSRPVEIAKQAYVRTFLKSIDWVMADCTMNKRYYEGFGFPSDRITIMPAAVDNERFRQARASLDEGEMAELRSELDISSSHRIVLYVGKLIRRKRVGDLISAFNALPDSVDASLLIVGDGQRREHLEEQCDRHDLNDVVFAGFRDQQELPGFYELADVFALPSSYDPSPKVLNEAMNFELPVVAAEGVGSAYDLVKENGETYPAGDVETLTTILSEFLSDHADLETMGNRSREIIDEWDYDADVTALLQALSQLHLV